MAGKRKPTISAPSSTAVDWAEVERVLKLMDRHKLEEFEYSNGGFHVRLKRVAAGNPPGAAREPARPGEISSALETPALEIGENTHIVKSPIVGTYYAAPSPGANAFVKVGDHVEVGQVLCIIEAMKLMNEIESDVAGEITRIIADNGQPVEYGEPLFSIRPSGSHRPS